MAKQTYFPKTGTVKLDRGDQQILLTWDEPNFRYSWKVVADKNLLRRGAGDLFKLYSDIKLTNEEFLFSEKNLFGTTYPLPRKVVK